VAMDCNDATGLRGNEYVNKCDIRGPRCRIPLHRLVACLAGIYVSNINLYMNIMEPILSDFSSQPLTLLFASYNRPCAVSISFKFSPGERRRCYSSIKTKCIRVFKTSAKRCSK
jgi:hypothetical protein